MSWGAIGGATIGAIAGTQGSSGGGLPKWLKEPSKELANNVSNVGPQRYYPGQNYVGGLPSEQAAFDERNAYNQQMFGQGGMFQNVLGAGNNQFSGNNYGSQMAGAVAPFATNQMMNAFAQGPGQVGRYGFNTQLDAAGMAPQFGQAGSLDATGALNSMLSGTPDYSGAQGAIDAANAPLLRQLNEQIIPGLNQKATFLNNPTGGIKTLNRVMPEIGQRMSENALGVMEGERQRALQSQQNAAGMVSQGGMQSYGLGLQGAMGQADLQRMLAGQNYQTDYANANFGSQFRGDTLGLGNLGGNILGQDARNSQNWASMFPELLQAGQQPSQDAANYGAYQRMLGEQQIAGNKERWDFGQQAPYNQYGFQAGVYQQLAGGAQQQPQGSSALGGLGGAIAGMGLGQSVAGMFGGYTPNYQGGGAPMVNQPSGNVNVTAPDPNWTNMLGGYTG